MILTFTILTITRFFFVTHVAAFKREPINEVTMKAAINGGYQTQGREEMRKKKKGARIDLSLRDVV